jgi:hypothetical protein
MRHIIEFRSKNTEEKVIEFEIFPNTVVYWCNVLDEQDENINLPYSGSDEVSDEKGWQMIKVLSGNKKLKRAMAQIP